MPVSAICEVCGSHDNYGFGEPFEEFTKRLRARGWKLDGPRTICPSCARGEQELLEGATIITYGIHPLRHEPGRWGGIYWLWQKGGAYRGQFQIPETQSFPSEEEARAFARADAMRRIRAAEWP